MGQRREPGKELERTSRCSIHRLQPYRRRSRMMDDSLVHASIPLQILSSAAPPPAAAAGARISPPSMPWVMQPSRLRDCWLCATVCVDY